MKGFARVTKLGNIKGRADYMTNPNKQEHIMAKSEEVDWKPYQEFERNNQKSATKNNEGREIIIMLPNDWSKLPEAELSEKAQKIAVTAVEKSTDMQWAVHWNKTHSNLHMHVIFSERKIEKNPKKWDRDVYLTEDGKVARKKAERAKNPDGTFRLIHKKGDLKGGFTAKDTRYAERSWIYTMKEKVVREFSMMGVDMERNDPLHQYHEGKGAESGKIHEKNILIKQNNEVIKKLSGELPDFPIARLKQIALECVKNHEIMRGDMIKGELERYGYQSNALSHEALPELVQKAPESVLEPSMDKAEEKPLEEPKTKYEALSGMEKAYSDWKDNNKQLYQCKFWEISKKRNLQKKADECLDKFKYYLKNLQMFGCARNISYIDIYHKPELMESLKEKIGMDNRSKPQSEDRQSREDSRDSRLMSLEMAKEEIRKERESAPAVPDRSKKRMLDRGEPTK